jgi:hypothetical protein
MVVWSLIRSQQDVFRLAYRIYFIVAISDLIALISCSLACRPETVPSLQTVSMNPSLSKCTMTRTCTEEPSCRHHQKLIFLTRLKLPAEKLSERAHQTPPRKAEAFSESSGVEDPLDVSKTSGPGNLWYQAPFVHASLPAMLVIAILRFDCHICD